MSKAPPEASGFPVYCAHTKIVALKSLKPHPRNPNKHPERQIAKLAAIIKANGWRQPIVVSERSGLVVKGHGRILAAQVLKAKFVPVDVQPYASDAAEIQDLIADNRIPELSYRENKDIVALIDELAQAGGDTEATGYAHDEVAALLKSLDDLQDGHPPAGAGPEGEADTVIVIGPYRVPLPRVDFLKWQEEVRQSAGFDTASIHAEIKRRLKL